ncbi:MAG: hypothetical protein AB7H77_01555 [Bdellovibrionales bacterium]
MDNKIWTENILRLVEEFSSEEFQKRVWVTGETLYRSSYAEALCQFFDMKVDQLIDVEWRQVGLSESQRNKLALFRDALNMFNDKLPKNTSSESIINSADWVRIRQLAKESLEEFLPPKGIYHQQYIKDWWITPPNVVI